jgi:hypothetical protein
MTREEIARYDLDISGHHARSNVFRLHVDERATPDIVLAGE